MIAQTLLLLTVAFGPSLQDEAADSMVRKPSELPVAEPGRWDGLFNGRDVVPDQFPVAVGEIFKRGGEAYARRDYPTALTASFELLELEPDFPPSLLELGTAYFRLRRYGDSVVCLERFLAVAPSQVWRTQVLGHAYYSLGRYDEALEHYRVVVAELPESAEALRGFALTHYRLGESDRALQLLARVIELDAEHAEAHMWLAQILYEEERTDEALKAALKARDVARFQPRSWYLLWQIYLELGRTKDAESAQREWKRVDTLVQEIRSLKGQLLFRPKEYGLAMSLASLQQQLGDSDGVRRAFGLAVRSRPESVTELSLRLHVLDVLFEMQDAEGAAEAAEALGRSCSREPEAWKRLQVYYARVGNAAMQVRAGELYLRMSRER